MAHPGSRGLGGIHGVLPLGRPVRRPSLLDVHADQDVAHLLGGNPMKNRMWTRGGRERHADLGGETDGSGEGGRP